MTLINPDSGQFKTTGQVRVINPDGNEEIVEVPMQHVVEPPDVKAEFIEDLVRQTLNLLASSKSEHPYFEVLLPLRNSGGSTYNSILTVCVDKREGLLYILVQREGDNPEDDTVSGPVINYKKKDDDVLIRELRKMFISALTKDVLSLAQRASLRAGYSEFQARQNLE